MKIYLNLGSLLKYTRNELLGFWPSLCLIHYDNKKFALFPNDVVPFTKLETTLIFSPLQPMIYILLFLLIEPQLIGVITLVDHASPNLKMVLKL